MYPTRWWQSYFSSCTKAWWMSNTPNWIHLWRLRNSFKSKDSLHHHQINSCIRINHIIMPRNRRPARSAVTVQKVPLTTTRMHSTRVHWLDKNVQRSTTAAAITRVAHRRNIWNDHRTALTTTLAPNRWKTWAPKMAFQFHRFQWSNPDDSIYQMWREKAATRQVAIEISRHHSTLNTAVSTWGNHKNLNGNKEFIVHFRRFGKRFKRRQQLISIHQRKPHGHSNR